MTKIEQVTCNKIMVFWRNLSKTSLFDQVLQDQVPNNVSKIDAASKIINSEQHWEQDWSSSYPCGWRFIFFWALAFAKFWSHLLNSAASFSTCLLAVLYMLVTQAHPCTCLWKAIHFGHGRGEQMSTERIFLSCSFFGGASLLLTSSLNYFCFIIPSYYCFQLKNLRLAKKL